MVENTQPWNSAFLLEHATEDKCIDRVGGTITNHLAKTLDSRKHPSGSSLKNVRGHLNFKF